MTATERPRSSGHLGIATATPAVREDHAPSTTASTTALLRRLTLAVVIFPHGAQKVLGAFGGPGLGARDGAPSSATAAALSTFAAPSRALRCDHTQPALRVAALVAAPHRVGRTDRALRPRRSCGGDAGHFRCAGVTISSIGAPEKIAAIGNESSSVLPETSLSRS